MGTWHCLASTVSVIGFVKDASSGNFLSAFSFSALSVFGIIRLGKDAKAGNFFVHNSFVLKIELVSCVLFGNILLAASILVDIWFSSFLGDEGMLLALSTSILSDCDVLLKLGVLLRGLQTDDVILFGSPWEGSLDVVGLFIPLAGIF